MQKENNMSKLSSLLQAIELGKKLNAVATAPLSAEVLASATRQLRESLVELLDRALVGLKPTEIALENIKMATLAISHELASVKAPMNTCAELVNEFWKCRKWEQLLNQAIADLEIGPKPT